jgi:quercetin dioxygenase-like cupin family protein
MPLLQSPSCPTFDLPALSVRGLAAPSRGARETCVWRLVLPPGAPGAVHSVDREEIFVGLSGQASATLDGVTHQVGPGDTLIVPAGRPFALANPGAEPFEALAVLPVGGLATMASGETICPPWTV